MKWFRSILIQHVKSLGKNCSTAQKNELLEKCRKLEARITTYEHRLASIIKVEDDIQWLPWDGNIDIFDSDTSDIMADESPDGWFAPEKEQITLPSNLALGEVDHLSMQPMAKVECELCKAQVSDALDGL